MGLEFWPKQSSISLRERVESLWEASGLLEPVTMPADAHLAEFRLRWPPIQAGGQPASEIVIEQRGAL